MDRCNFHCRHQLFLYIHLVVAVKDVTTRWGQMLSNCFSQSTSVMDRAPCRATKWNQLATYLTSENWKLCGISYCSMCSMQVNANAPGVKMWHFRMDAGDAEMPRKLHLPALNDFPLANM